MPSASDRYSLAWAASILGSNEPVCAACGSARSTRTASEFLRSTGLTCFACGTSATSAPAAFPESTSSAAASPARTSHSPARAQGSTAPARVFGSSTPESFASFDPATSSWRTSQLSVLGASTEFSGTWPRAGLMRSGTAYRLQPLVRLTRGTASGLLPTPTPTRATRNGAPTVGRSKEPGGTGDDVACRRRDGKMWPTPTERRRQRRVRRRTPSGTGPGRDGPRWRRSNELSRSVAAERLAAAVLGS
jgi:hypothetical protein